MRQRGSAMIEMLVGALIAMLVGAGLFQLMRASYISEAEINSTNNAITNTRTPVDVLADHLRNAQPYDGDNKAVVKEGLTNDITYYTDNAGSTVRYRLNGTDLQRTDSTGTTTVAANVTSLTFTYFTAASYNDSTGVTPTADTHHPTDAERPFLAIINIQAGITVGGVARTYTTQVRLRNSPRKNSL